MTRLARPALYAGVVAIVVGLGKYHAATAGGYDFTESSRFGWALAYAVLLCLAAYALGLPEVPRRPRSRLWTAFAAPAAGALAVAAVQLVSGDAQLPRFVVFGSALVLPAWYYTIATVADAGRSSSERKDRVVVVGSAELALELANELGRSPEKPASVVSQLSEDQASGGVGAAARSLESFARLEGATVVVLSAHAQTDERIIDQAARLHESGVRVRTLSLFYEEWLGKIPVVDLGRVALFFDIGEVHRLRFGRVKRIVDVGFAAVGAVALVSVLPAIIVGNALANRGPIFYVQERIGRHGVVFRIVKFRSMSSAVGGGSDWTSEHDPRVTPFGRLLRVTHLDELPQVLNILKGDLSLVGPRPEQPRYVDELKQKLPYYDLRHIVRPGLTGWAQVKYGYAGDERDALEKLQYDFHYLRRQSLSFDLRIVGRTIRSVSGIQGRGR